MTQHAVKLCTDLVCSSEDLLGDDSRVLNRVCAIHQYLGLDDGYLYMGRCLALV